MQLHSVDQSGSVSSSSLEEIMDRAYERYEVGLRRVQLLYSKSGQRSHSLLRFTLPAWYVCSEPVIGLQERPGRRPGCRAHRSNTSCSPWISLCTSLSVWWRRTPGCLGRTLLRPGLTEQLSDTEIVSCLASGSRCMASCR